MKLWYLSFADEGWLGACVVEAETLHEAITKSWALGINPGGQVLFGEIEGPLRDKFPRDYLDKFLERKDLESIDKKLGGTGELTTRRAG